MRICMEHRVHGCPVLPQVSRILCKDPVVCELWKTVARQARAALLAPERQHPRVSKGPVADGQVGNLKPARTHHTGRQAEDKTLRPVGNQDTAAAIRKSADSTPAPATPAGPPPTLSARSDIALWFRPRDLPSKHHHYLAISAYSDARTTTRGANTTTDPERRKWKAHEGREQDSALTGPNTDGPRTARGADTLRCQPLSSLVSRRN